MFYKIFHEEKAPVSCNTPTQHAITVQLTGIHSISDIWCYWLVRTGWDLYFSANYEVMRWGPVSDPMQLWVGLSFFSNDAFIRPVYCLPSVRPNDGWDLNLYDDDIAWGGEIIGSCLGGFGHLQGCGQNSSKVRVSAINYIPWKATTGWLQTKKSCHYLHLHHMNIHTTILGKGGVPDFIWTEETGQMMRTT